ncbi:RdgB/HAM1 family non-canonical purine NTP pyrophosphatase [Rhodovibrionaceae bacterium A322]
MTQSSPAPSAALIDKIGGPKLVIASHNQGKVREIAELLAPLGLEVVSASVLDLPEPDETGKTFVANAELKARAAALACGLPCLADDSGLSVSALGGDPGIYSARWAGPEKDFNLAMQKVEEGLTGKEDRSASFYCVLTLARPEGAGENLSLISFEGRVDGTLVWPPKGDQGFGYDPVFQPTGHNITFGEMDPQAKHGMSHRADAFNQFLAWLTAGTEE